MTNFKIIKNEFFHSKPSFYRYVYLECSDWDITWGWWTLMKLKRGAK